MLYIKSFTIAVIKKTLGWEASAKLSLNNGARQTIYLSRRFDTASKARYAIMKAVNVAESELPLTKR